MTDTTSTLPNFAAPTPQSDRIVVLDSLRGIAILGILLMNIPGFGLPAVVAHDPYFLHENGSINFKIWYFVEWFPEGTLRAIFSMLFGAGIILFTGRQENKLDGVMPADYFIRRQLWLMVFGLIDIYLLLWWGDILFDYGCYGIIMYAFRKLPVKGLLIAAGICFLLSVARDNRDFYLDKKIITKGEIAAAVDTTKTKLTSQQKEDLGEMMDFKDDCTQEKKMSRMKRSIRKTTGDYESLYEHRTGIYLKVIIKYLYLSLWDVLLFMFLGMAFFKTGVLTGQANAKIYWAMAILGLSLGLMVSWLRIEPMLKYSFNEFDYTKNVRLELYTVSRTLRALGIFGIIMLLFKSGWFKWLFSLMRPVGQMAFTNYLMQSLICGLVFYGIGFGMYGKFNRLDVYIVVAIIWTFQIIFCHIWLRYFYFGPLEWCWRSLTYWKKQTFRK